MGELYQHCDLYGPSSYVPTGYNLLDLPYDGVVKHWSECCEFWILSENKVYCNKENETRPNMMIYNPKSSKIGCSVNLLYYLLDIYHIPIHN